MSKRQTRRDHRHRSSAEFRRSDDSHILHFYSGSFALDGAEFENVAAAGEPSAIAKRALVMVEGSHTDSQKRNHIFDKSRILRFASNTNAFLRTGGRVPWQQDHQKTQATNLGDLEGELIPEVITRANLPDPRLSKLIGKLGLFTDRLVAKGSQAVQDVLDGKIKTLSPGIDLAADIIREISATPTPAIVGLSTFRRADSDDSRMARFALTMEQAGEEDQDYDAMEEEFKEIGDRFWRVVTDIGKAPPEEFEGEDPSAFLEQALADYSNMIAEMLRLGDDEDVEGDRPNPGTDPRTAGQQSRPVSDQQRRFSMATDLSYYSMGDVLGVAEFGRGKDKKPRKRRNTAGTVAVGGAGLGTVGAAGRYGLAGRAGLRANAAAAGAKQPGRVARLFGARGPQVTTSGKAFRSGAGQALSRDRARLAGAVGRAPGGRSAVNTARRVGRAIGRSAVVGGIRNAAGSAAAGYRGGSTIARQAGRGSTRQVAAGVGRGLSFASKTRGGKAGLALAGVGALGAGATKIRRRKRRSN